MEASDRFLALLQQLHGEHLHQIEAYKRKIDPRSQYGSVASVTSSAYGSVPHMSSFPSDVPAKDGLYLGAVDSAKPLRRGSQLPYECPSPTEIHESDAASAQGSVDDDAASSSRVRKQSRGAVLVQNKHGKLSELVNLASAPTNSVSGLRKSNRKAAQGTFLWKLVQSSIFECTMCGIILLNAIYTAVVLQFDSYMIGIEIGYDQSVAAAGSNWSPPFALFKGLSWCFAAVFFAECVLKLCAFRLAYFCDYWNALDVIILILSGIELFDVWALNASYIRLLRMVRLARLLKVVKALASIDSLFLFVTAAKDSMSVFCWCCLIFAILNLVFAIFLNQVLHQMYFRSDSIAKSEKEELFHYVGSLTTTYFTMFELMLGNFSPACRLLAKHAGEVYLFLGCLYKLSIGFAMVGIVNGILISETFKAFSLDDKVMVKQTKRAQKILLRKLISFFAEADRDGDGTISQAEFEHICEDREIHLWLKSLGLDVSDTLLVFQLLDRSGDGLISIDELLSNFAKLQGSARSVDLLDLMRQHNKSLEVMDQMMAEIRSLTRVNKRKVEDHHIIL